MLDADSWIATYIVANRPYGTLYVGVTSRLPARTGEHRDKVIEGFTRRYGLVRLVWYQSFELMTSAIQREKTIKHWPRDWKINLIERDNPHWEDLFPSLFAVPDGPLSQFNQAPPAL